MSIFFHFTVSISIILILLLLSDAVLSDVSFEIFAVHKLCWPYLIILLNRILHVNGIWQGF